MRASSAQFAAPLQFTMWTANTSTAVLFQMSVRAWITKATVMLHIAMGAWAALVAKILPLDVRAAMPSWFSPDAWDVRVCTAGLLRWSRKLL